MFFIYSNCHSESKHVNFVIVEFDFNETDKIEKIIFPSHYHIKVSVSGCPNDCGKGHFNDFGIMGIREDGVSSERCIGCGACVRACQHHATRSTFTKC